MIEKSPGEPVSDLDEHFEMPAMIRLGAWGLSAVLAVVVAMVAANANLNARRAGVATSSTVSKTVSPVVPPPEVATDPRPVIEAKPQLDSNKAETKPAADPPKLITAAQLLARANDPDAETKRLAEAVRLLTQDRDRLATRIAALERNIDDLTGSISRATPAPSSRPLQSDNGPGSPANTTASLSPQPPAPVAPPLTRTAMAGPAAVPDSPPPSAAMTAPAIAPPATAAANAPPATTDAPVPRPGPMSTIEFYTRSTTGPADDPSPAGSVATATDFGVDLGGATSVNGLRALWTTLKGKHAQLLNGLWPVMSVRDRAKPGTVELRLVAGPLPNAGNAARLCAAFTTAGVICQPTVFDGQRLALR